MSIIVRELGLCDYQTVWRQMMDFTDNRTTDTPDEIWLSGASPGVYSGLGG